MKNTIRPVKGTRDFYPPDMAVRNWINGIVRETSTEFGYQEFDGPFIESLELYAAKSGDELVKEQAFVFSDRGGDLVALRPELTPSLARMVAQNQSKLIFPIRWWSWGPFWRYERPQKGRSREFFQWNIDLIGTESVAADAEIISIAANFLKKSGIKSNEVRILVNNRKLMESELRKLDFEQDDFSLLFHFIDKREKMEQVTWEKYAESNGLNPNQIDGIQNILENNDLWLKSKYLTDLFDIIQVLGVGDYVSYSPQIIRGLDYYTSTVFEAWDEGKEFRAILGGGRYDNLVSDVGGEKLAAVGFAMGDIVMRLVLEKFDCIPPQIFGSPASIMVTLFDNETIKPSYEFAQKLRDSGFQALCYPEVVKLSKQLKYGDRIGIKLAIILGPDEIQQQKVSIKDLRTGEQYIVDAAKSFQLIGNLLDKPHAS